MMPQVIADRPGARPGERLVFVYGTLRAGGTHDIRRLAPAPRWVGPGRVQGRLYHLGAYPGLMRGQGGWVYGEIYAIVPALEVVLDAIEEVWPQRTGEYLRREVQVMPVPGDDRAMPLRCLVYEIDPRRILGRPWIEGGDWIAACAPPV